MKPDQIRKLVGGYATGTLTVEERRALLEAALRDQELFDELAREQALKDLLEDPLARRQLLDAVGEKPAAAAAFLAWWKRPAVWALAGGLASLVLLVAVFVRPPGAPPRPEPVLMAKREPAPMPMPAPREPQATVETRAKDEASVLKPAEPEAAVAENKSLEAVRAKDELAEAPPPAPPPGVNQPVLAAGQEAQPQMDAVRQPAPEADASRERKTARTSANVGMAGGVYRPDLAARSSAVPYRLLGADASGNYTEVGADTVFRRGGQVRVTFEPTQSGRLMVTSGASKTLLDVNVVTGASTNLDVPPGESRLIVTFTRAGGTSAAPFEIRILRE